MVNLHCPIRAEFLELVGYSLIEYWKVMKTVTEPQVTTCDDRICELMIIIDYHMIFMKRKFCSHFFHMVQSCSHVWWHPGRTRFMLHIWQSISLRHIKSVITICDPWKMAVILDEWCGFTLLCAVWPYCYKVPTALHCWSSPMFRGLTLLGLLHVIWSDWADREGYNGSIGLSSVGSVKYNL